MTRPGYHKVSGAEVKNILCLEKKKVIKGYGYPPFYYFFPPKTSPNSSLSHTPNYIHEAGFYTNHKSNSTNHKTTSMRNATTLFLVAFATVLSTLTSTTTAQVGDSPWCRVYMTSCEDLRKTNCDAKVPNNDRNLTWITAHCSTVTSSTGVCRYFSPDCSCSYTNVADMNRTVMVPLGPAALDQTQLRKFLSDLFISLC